MLIHGMVEILDSLEPTMPRRSLRSSVSIGKLYHVYCVSVKNSMYKQCITYKIRNIVDVYSKFVKEGKLGLVFKDPKHQVLIKADNVKMLEIFFSQLQNIILGKPVFITTCRMPKIVPSKKSLVKKFDPMNVEFIAIDRFDNRVLNMKNLKKLVLEDCTLSSLPLMLGNLPIEYLSLSNSVVGTTEHGKDTRWDCLTLDTICNTLKTLKIDSIDLYAVPFEILFLKNLQLLCLADNKLSYLPQFIGELPKLLTLSVANNNISYFPFSLKLRRFQEMDISQNSFVKFSLVNDHILAYTRANDINVPSVPVLKSLSHLALSCIIQNHVKFKRQDIPRALWHYYNVTGRCIRCHRCILPHYARITHIRGTPSTVTLIKGYHTSDLKWQMFECNKKCEYVH